MNLPLLQVSDVPPASWDDYAGRQGLCKAYHHSRWIGAIADLFENRVFYLSAVGGESNNLVGSLPLIRQRSQFFADRLVSLPYVNYGGVLADSEQIRNALFVKAGELAQTLGVDQLEIRDSIPPPSGWACRSDKVTLLLDLPDSTEIMAKRLGSKLRSQVRRAERERPTVEVGTRDRIGDFYKAWSEVMRDLGTPAYPRKFFEFLASALESDCKIITVRCGGQPVAGAFLVGYRDTLEVPWAGTISAMKPKAMNMYLYWEIIKFAIANGYKVLDFGRSTIDSGPYKFKLQWGAQPKQLYWAVWPPEKSQVRESGAMAMATRVWSKLPLPVANFIGPIISPKLPW